MEQCHHPLDITFTATLGRVGEGDPWTCVQMVNSAESATPADWSRSPEQSTTTARRRVHGPGGGTHNGRSLAHAPHGPATPAGCGCLCKAIGKADDDRQRPTATNRTMRRSEQPLLDCRTWPPALGGTRRPARAVPVGPAVIRLAFPQAAPIRVRELSEGTGDRPVPAPFGNHGA